MGSYALLQIGELVVHEVKNGVDSLCTLLFTEIDREFPLTPEQTRAEPGFFYRTSVANAIDRLRIQGVTYEKAVAAFDQGRDEIYQSRWEEHVAARHFLDDDQVGNLDEGERQYYESIKDEAEYDFCQSYTFDSWLSTILIESDTLGLEPVTEDYNPPLPIAQEIADYFLGFPNLPIFALRVLLEQFDADDEVILDCTDLVEGGWLALHAELCQCSPQVTILTEGPTDIDLLKPTLSVLYPHLEELFAFMDFRSLNIEANAGALVKIIKAFIGSGIKQRIVALFDNDAAGSDALRSLKMEDLPDNIRVAQLPHLPLAADYPTIGPQGEHNSDVNGCACSIELYLGEDILRNETGELTEIRWGAYINGVGRYQGEINNKKQIQKKYLDLIYTVDYASQLPEHDWSGMRLLFSALFKALE